MKGKVKQLPDENRPGVIRGVDKYDYLFTLGDVRSDPNSLKIGQEVDFRNIYLGGKHLAQKLNSIGSIQPVKRKVKPPESRTARAPESPDSSSTPSQRQSGFVNPYNFVPLCGEVPRCEPTSHEYFVGNSGQIICKLKLKTPFFTPHPERRFRLPDGTSQITEIPKWIADDHSAKAKWQDLISKNAGAGHEMLGLLKDEQDRHFMHGSLLKGAFRSVAEALSNSCLSVIDFQWDMLEKPHDAEVRISGVANYYSSRQVQSPPFVGRVIELATPEKPGTIEISTERTVRSRGQQVSRSQQGKIFFRPAHMPKGVRVFGDELSQYRDGDPVVAVCKTFTQTIHVRGRTIPIPILTVQNLRLDKGEKLQEGEKRGIIRITDVTDEKKSHRFISWPRKPRTVNFSWSAQLAYNRASEIGIEYDRALEQSKLFLEIENNRKIGKRSRRHELDVGDIVYFKEYQGQVEDMGPVELYRTLHKHSLDSLLWQKHCDFLTCHEINRLCPSCRIFGWVHPSPKDEDKDVAHKGFVHFNTAILDQEVETNWVTLKPLGQPHPSCWQFYLDAQNSGDDAGYNDENATIRGRKFYWHQPCANVDSVKDERRTELGDPQPPDDQNKTVELLLPKTEQNTETTFTFTVDFENLSDADLGLLLLAIQPNLLGEDNVPSLELYHHLGMGKPLGLGSAEVDIEEITLIDRVERYQDLTKSGRTALKNIAQSHEVRKVIDAFVRKALKHQSKQVSGTRTDRQNFAKMEHVEALLLMLDWQKNPKEVRYPPGHADPNTKEYWEAFRWFAHEDQRGTKPKNMLLTPRQIALEGRRQDFMNWSQQRRRRR